MHRIAVIGTGYVGLVSGACFAELGNDVVCIDVDAAKIARLQRGDSPLFEPGLEELVRRNAEAGRLAFTLDLAEGIHGREIVIIAVGTPTADDGHLDLRHVRQAALDIAAALDGPKIVVNKSTVPVQDDGSRRHGRLQPGVHARGFRRRRLHASGPHRDRRRSSRR
jgi:UDPglucose 6-dehydrogenase